MRFARSRSLTVTLLALGLPSLSLAHTGVGSGFMQGVAHPMGGVDHLLAMVAVGLLAGRAGGAVLWQIPMSFITMMGCGTLVGMAAVPLPFIEVGVALSVVVFGVMLASKRNPTLLLTSLVVGFFALFHGHAHGTEAAGDISGLAYAVGLLSMSTLLHACGLAIALRWGTQRSSVLRLCGSGLIVSGVGLFAGLL